MAMTEIEIIICLILLFMTVPDLAEKLKRPALTYAVFVLFGLVLSPIASTGVATMLIEAGKVGFLLLLFQVGLEIDLPDFRTFFLSVGYALGWALVQYPIILALGTLIDLKLGEMFLAAAALTSCSVGMAHSGWKAYPGLSSSAKPRVLHIMVALEILAIVVLAVNAAVLDGGLGWVVIVKMGAIGSTVVLISVFAGRLSELFKTIIEKTTHWRVHWITLLLLAVCALGERLGLSAAKTAFFLGLFMSRTKHDGLNLEEQMAPISQRFLIPIFFVGLGVQVPWQMLINRTAFYAVGTAFLLLGFREVIHRRWFKTGGDDRAFLLFCPNLTIVALASAVLLEHGSNSVITSWLLLTGLILSVTSILLLPPSGERDHF